MKCPSCQQTGLLVESLPNGDKRVRCQKCGYTEVQDKEGRKLLLDTTCGGNILLS